MDVHEEMFYAATNSAAAAAGDETDLYNGALRSRPMMSDATNHDGSEMREADWAKVGYDRKNNVGFVVGIFCIGLFQFQAPIRRWIRDRVHLLRTEDPQIEGPQIVLDLLLLMLVSSLEYMRAAYQIMVSTLRDQWPSPKRLRRRNNDRRNRCNSLPELEDCADVVAAEKLSLPQSHGGGIANIASAENNHSTQQIQPQNEIEIWDWGPIPLELEPAFLEERQYPRDWLMYHPKLRVVTRQEAMRYDRELAKQQQSPVRREKKKPALGGSVLAREEPASFEDEKKDDVGYSIDDVDNTESAEDEARILDNKATAATNPSPNRRANDPPRQQKQQQRERATNKNNMPILRSVVAT